MALTDEEFKRTLEEYKELGHEYRYREQMMVQEFSFSAVATAGLLNVLLRAPTPSPAVTVVLHVFGAMFLMLLALHLRNINQDRVATINRKRVLSDKLEFEQTHLNVGTFQFYTLALWWCNQQHPELTDRNQPHDQRRIPYSRRKPLR